MRLITLYILLVFLKLKKPALLFFSYHYSGYPREATSYPVYEDTRGDRGGYERSYDRGGYRGRGGPRYDNYAGRGGR